MLPIQKKPIAYNFTNSTDQRIYIVVHDTGNKSSGANALSHYNYFNGGDRQSSANYFVDDNNILELVDPKIKYSWHCGDGAGRYGITNRNSIGVETCINSDGDYNKAIQNTIELVAFLMKQFNISIDKVVRHYDASHKNCPQMMNQNGNWSGWVDFKSKLNSYITNQSQPTNNNTIIKEEIKVKNLVVYGNSVDMRASQYLADYLNCAILDGSIPFDYSQIENVYCVGGAPTTNGNVGWTSYAKKIITGSDRFDTMIQVLKYIGRL